MSSINFIKFLINEAVTNAVVAANNYIVSSDYKKLDKKYKTTLGLIPDPDDEADAVKAKRYDFGLFTIQPPFSYTKLSEEQRHHLYKKVRETLELILEAVKAVKEANLEFIFTGRPDGDKSKTIVRLVADKNDEYAAMYQQEDDDKDGIWEQGDFIINVFAKNNNIHTLVHEMGHKFYYECLTDDQAKQWKEYYKTRKFRDKQEFVSKYASENDREDAAECFAVYVLGDEKINSLYDEKRINKNQEILQKLMIKFKQIMIKPIHNDIEKQHKLIAKEAQQRTKNNEKKRKEYMRVLANLYRG